MYITSPAKKDQPLTSDCHFKPAFDYYLRGRSRALSGLSSCPWVRGEGVRPVLFCCSSNPRLQVPTTRQTPSGLLPFLICRWDSMLSKWSTSSVMVLTGVMTNDVYTSSSNGAVELKTGLQCSTTILLNAFIFFTAPRFILPFAVQVSQERPPSTSATSCVAFKE